MASCCKLAVITSLSPFNDEYLCLLLIEVMNEHLQVSDGILYLVFGISAVFDLDVQVCAFIFNLEDF